MISPEEQPMEPSQPPAPTNSGGGRRRRGRRGGRGRGRGAPRPAQTAHVSEPAGVPAEVPSAPEGQISSGGKDDSAISQAVNEVQQIIASLEQVLEQMEEVRELVERVERQESADEHEIESLRRALRRIQQPHGRKDTQPESGDD